MTDKDILNDPEIDRQIEEFFRLYDERIAAQRLKRENPYVRDIIAALLPYRNGRHLSWVVDDLEKARKAKGLPIPKAFRETVQSAYNTHSISSAHFRNGKVKEADAIFYAAGGVGSGYWGVDRDKATTWLAAKVQGS